MRKAELNESLRFFFFNSLWMVILLPYSSWSMFSEKYVMHNFRSSANLCFEDSSSIFQNNSILSSNNSHSFFVVDKYEFNLISFIFVNDLPTTIQPNNFFRRYGSSYDLLIYKMILNVLQNVQQKATLIIFYPKL